MKFKPNVLNLQALNALHNTLIKVGVLGGSFDPAHEGHLMISKQALDFYHFDKVIWLVANQNPFKPQKSNDCYTRAAQAANVARYDNRIIVSTAEKELGTFYTYQSMEFLVKRFQSVKFTWLMGIDNLLDFKKWHRFSDLIKLCEIIIFDRPNTNRLINVGSILQNDQPNLDKTQKHHIIVHRGKLLDLSSTMIRESKK
ncbi:MAG: nicotinate-nicotinamide nucleotide adenylyltransferase [Rickettsiales bacterium]|nr:nicotinate-nicotinamide nucleotide adenylyltransferase [Rickettsiales bacterium]